MIRILMKKQLKMLFSGFFVDRKTGKSRPKGAVVCGIVIYIALILGCMGSMFGSVAYSMCAPALRRGTRLDVYGYDGYDVPCHRYIWKRVQYICELVSGKRQ